MCWDFFSMKIRMVDLWMQLNFPSVSLKKWILASVPSMCVTFPKKNTWRCRPENCTFTNSPSDISSCVRTESGEWASSSCAGGPTQVATTSPTAGGSWGTATSPGCAASSVSPRVVSGFNVFSPGAPPSPYLCTLQHHPSRNYKCTTVCA